MSTAEQIHTATGTLAYDSLLALHQAAWNAIPLGMALFDADGRIVRRNGPAELIWSGGSKPVRQGWPRHVSAGETASAVEQALRFGTPAKGLREVFTRNDGVQMEIASDVKVFRDPSGRIRGVLHCFREVDAFLDADNRRRLSQAQEHLASIVAHSDDAIISKDLNGIILSWNKGAERLFGYTAREAIGKSITMLIPEHRFDEEPEILRRIRSGERIDHYETVRRRKDGTLVDISLTVSPMRDEDGNIVAASKIGHDISGRKRAEAQRNLLVAELNHRVKNTLATVISIARQSFPGAAISKARTAFEARIRGLAQTHGRLADANWQSVSLETLFADEFAPYRQSENRNVTLAGPNVDLSPKCALTLGLAIHELATNAAKYGALTTDKGMVDVRWTVDPRDLMLDISWTEHDGPPVIPPQRSGFGRLLLERALVCDLESEVHLHFDPGGLRCHIRIQAAQYRARL